MASQELLHAAVLQLRAKALESYAIVKDILHSPAEEGDVNTIATHALKVAQYEGAMLTLQGYEKDLLVMPEPPSKEEASYSTVTDITEEELEAHTPPEPTGDEEDASGGPGIRISEEELISKSPTYKKSLQDAKLKGLNKKKDGE